jgi:hypothetical protein
MTPPDAPWHRQFWPWFIIALLALSVAGSLVSAWLAVSHPDTVLEHDDDSAAPAATRTDG